MALSGFPAAARRALGDSQLRANLARATSTIRDKRGRVVAELPDWEELRASGAAIKDAALLGLDSELERLEAAVTAAGGHVHWANDGDEACSHRRRHCSLPWRRRGREGEVDRHR